MQEQKASHTVLSHLRANFWLLVLTLVICCTLYPAAVWVVGQVCFHDSAQGSLLDANGQSTSDPSKAVGSKLIAQSFNSAWFFQSRPSAVSYAANASGASNYAASNPKLRGRVAAQLGPIVRYSEAYTKGHPKPDGGDPNPQDDIKAWFKAQTDAKRDLFTEWANNNSSIAQAWATGGWVVGSTSVKDYILQWAKDHPDVVAAWKNDNPNVKTDPGADALVSYFFKSYEKEHFGTWPTAEAPGDITTRIVAWAKDHADVVKKWKAANPKAEGEPKDADLLAFFYSDYTKNPKDWPPLDPAEWVDANDQGVVTAIVKPDAQDSDVQSIFFDTWLTEQATAKKLDPLKDFAQVPADMVTTSGSGLDPDISLANAVYQKDTVVPAYADKIATDLVARDENKNLRDDQKKKLHDDLTEKLKPEVGKVVDKLLAELASRPMFGLTGDKPLVNVLQLNLRLQAEAAKIQVP